MTWNWYRRMRNFVKNARRAEEKTPDARDFADENDGPPAPVDDSARESASAAEKIYINLGIDFGTSFTKVGFWDSNEETIIVTFEACGKDEEIFSPEEAMIPSIVSVGDDGTLSMAPASAEFSGVQERYLKIRLAEIEKSGLLTDNEKKTRALSSWFLATVVLRAQEWIRQNEEERLRGHEVAWSANVGVPVEYCDSPAIDTFREALFVAWTWAENDEIPGTLESAISLYEETVRSFDPDRCEHYKCQPAAEVVAGARSFLLSGEAKPETYVYFDVGGGTVDGVVFNYQNPGGTQRVDVYSAKVAALGISEVAKRIGREGADLFNDDLAPEVCESLEPVGEEVQQFVSDVILAANKKIGKGKWILRQEDIRIFLGGGGGNSKWYRESVHSAYEEHCFGACDIPRFQEAAVPEPRKGLDMREMKGRGVFYRFAIAYGLSVPKAEGPKIELASRIEPAPDPEPWTPPFGRYEDSKDSSSD
ncbi:MAG: hypothetical protein MPJ52_00215 [Alphaproteobacteria bacterium]|nr:hypothetical protein [Alphaproteobacteria bacterium]